MFGEEYFRPKDVTERIKTFEDACQEMGEEHQFIKAYREWRRSENTQKTETLPQGRHGVD